MGRGFWLWRLATSLTPTLDAEPLAAPPPPTPGAEPGTRRLKVAVDAQSLQTAKTGVRTYVDELLRRFAAPNLSQRIVILRGPRRLPSGVRLFRIINQAMYLWWLHAWLPLRLWAGRYDVLFSPEYLTSFWSPVPVVVTFHDAMFLRRPQDYNRAWLWMFRHVSLPALRRARAVIVPSAHAGAETVQYAGVKLERISVVPLGGPSDGQLMRVDAALAERTLARYGVAAGRYVLHVGVLERRKNLVTLLRAFALWRERGAPEDFKVVLVGQKGPRPDLDDSKQIEQAIAELGLAERVVLTGHISREERDALYANAAVVAIPSLLEGFGIPVLEAFAAQVPVIVANSTSLPEVAGEAALQFDPERPEELAACLARVTGDAALRAELVKRGHVQLARFTWDHTAEETMAVFARVGRRA
jgi:glycosyltransferase involved in cell wall biosynthesis